MPGSTAPADRSRPDRSRQGPLAILVVGLLVLTAAVAFVAWRGGADAASNEPGSAAVDNGSETGDRPFYPPSGVDISPDGPHRSTTGELPPSSADEPTGNFRITCEFSHLGYWDPIVAPGDEAFMHLHMFWGNTTADADSTYESLRSNGESTCTGGPLNRTAYWMPAMFDSHGDVVVPSSYIAYYKAEATSDIEDLEEARQYLSATVPYPDGFRYIAGADAMTQTGENFSWYCSESGSKELVIPAGGCPEGEDLWVSVRFPHCWDGVNLDSPDHRSHVSYGVDGSSWTTCPPSHPVLLPSLTEIAVFPWASDIGEWYLSSDRMSEDPSAWADNGRTWHADWFGGWEPEIQEIWWQECLLGFRNATDDLCDGTVLTGGQEYGGPSRIGGWTPGPSRG